MKIRYLKTKEVFEIQVPDPLNVEGAVIFVKVSDYDLISLISGRKVEDLDDDAKLGVKLLCERYHLSTRILKLAKRQQHLRKLNRANTSWVELRKKERQPRSNSGSRFIDDERLQYLRDNFDEIAKNCVKHDWFDEYYRLCKDVKPGMKKQEIIDSWKNNRKIY